MLVQSSHTRAVDRQDAKTSKPKDSESCFMLLGMRRQTARLFLDPLQPEDEKQLHALFCDPEIRRYLWDDESIAPEVTQGVIERSQELFTEEKAGLWAVRLEPEGDLIGFGGYWYFFEPPERQILFGLSPKVWRQGLATELVKELLSYGFNELKLAEIIGCTDEPNLASQRVMTRAGMKLVGRQPGPKWENLRFAAQLP